MLTIVTIGTVVNNVRNFFVSRGSDRCFLFVSSIHIQWFQSPGRSFATGFFLLFVAAFRFGGERGAEPSRWLAGLHVGGPALRDCSPALCPAQVAAQLALRAQTCSPSPCQRQGANLGRPACLRRPHRRPASHRLGSGRPTGATPRSRARGTPPSGAPKGWAECRPGALWRLRSTASRWARAARIVI